MDDLAIKPSPRGVKGGNRQCQYSFRIAAPSRPLWRLDMKVYKLWLFAAPLAVLAAACGKTPADDSLKNDLALASQAQTFQPQQVTSPTEQSLAANPYTTPVRRAATISRAPTQTVRRTSTARSSGPGRVVYEPAPAPAPVVTKHTTRDAAIGAGAGAVIGAVASRDKVKGGLIGAAAGAILGGVIGNNVDISRKY